MLGQMRLDQDQVVQGNLQRRVACARATERLLDKHAERKYSASRSILTAALGLRKLPDNFNHLGSRIDEAIDEVDLSVGLSYQLRRGLLVDSCRRPTRILSLLQWREKLGAQRR
jgi:hypothetical protein